MLFRSGQYTHGAIWFALACLRAGEREDGYRALTMINPVLHTKTTEGQERYKGEGFVMPADVYRASGHEGEAGWTWYTGAAGWYWRCVVEALLGLKINRGKLTIEERLPEDIAQAEVCYRYKDTIYEVIIERGGDTLFHNGQAVLNNVFTLVDDRQPHRIHLRKSEDAI